jgi:hypothetical protein
VLERLGRKQDGGSWLECTDTNDGRCLCYDQKRQQDLRADRVAGFARNW